MNTGDIFISNESKIYESDSIRFNSPHGYWLSVLLSQDLPRCPSVGFSLGNLLFDTVDEICDGGGTPTRRSFSQKNIRNHNRYGIYARANYSPFKDVLAGFERKKRVRNLAMNSRADLPPNTDSTKGKEQYRAGYSRELELLKNRGEAIGKRVSSDRQAAVMLVGVLCKA